MDDERLKENRGGNYWKELLARIKDIRSFEKVLYRQVLDLYATAANWMSNHPVIQPIPQTFEELEIRNQEIEKNKNGINWYLSFK